MKQKLAFLFLLCLSHTLTFGQTAYINTFVNISGQTEHMDIDKHGNIYYTNNGDGIKKISPTGSITTIYTAYAGSSVTVDSNDNVYFFDGSEIKKIDGITGSVTHFAGRPFDSLNDRLNGDGGLADTAKMNPYVVKSDKKGNLYLLEDEIHYVIGLHPPSVTDTDNYFLRKIDPSGIMHTVIGIGSVALSDGYPTSSVSLGINAPQIAFDNAGLAYVANSDGVYKIDASSILHLMWYHNSYYIQGLAIDNNNNIYLSDPINDHIWKYSSSGVLSAFAGDPSIFGFSTGDGGLAINAGFAFEGSIVCDNQNNVYISDNGKIRIITTTNPPSFTGGTSQNLTVCRNSSVNSINSLLAITDADAGQTETWSVTSAPAHGTLSVSYSTTSTGSAITPTGLTYTPATGYSGTDAFTVQVSDGVATGFTTVNVNVSAGPVVAGITGTLTVCAGANTTLADATAGGTWSSSNTAVATINSSGMVHGVAGGNTTISYAASNTCGTTYATATATVNPLPNAGTIPATARILCRNVPTTLTATGDAGGTWSLSSTTYATINASTGVVTGLNVASTSANTATVTYTVTNGCGSAYTTLPIRIKGIPSASFSSGSFNMCVGDSRTITMSPSSPSYFTWATTSAVSIATISSNVAVVTAIAPGTSSTLTYTYTNATDSNVCNTTVQIGTSGYNVVAKPVYTISGTPILSTGGTGCASASTTLTVLPSPGTGSRWTWTPTSPTTYATLSCSTCTISTATALTSGGQEFITYTAYGSYCGSPSTATYTITVNACKPEGGGGSFATEDEQNMLIYPNPAHGSFTIELPKSGSPLSIIITDISGKVITTRVSAKPKEDFDFSIYPTGLYFVRVRSEDNIYTGKVLLE